MIRSFKQILLTRTTKNFTIFTFSGSLHQVFFFFHEEELKLLDAKDYELVIIGMPTYGDKPANAFNEIVRKVPNLSGKKTIIFTTARFSGGKALKYMKEKVQETCAQIVKEANFRRVFWLGKRKSTKFGLELNEEK